MSKFVRNYGKLGRPPGPRAGRGKRSWDPPYLRQKDAYILEYVFAHPEMPRYMIADKYGISSSRLSVLTCSSLGVKYLAQLERWEAELHQLKVKEDSDV